MNLFALAIPLLALVTNVLSLRTDPAMPEKRGARRLLFTAALITCVLAWGQSGSEAHNHQGELREQAQQHAKDLAASQKQHDDDVRAREEANAKLEASLSSVTLILCQAFGSGNIDACRSNVQPQVEANKARDQLLAAAAPGAASARRAIRVQYYEKDADPRRLAQALRAAGFTLDPRPPVNDLPTNAVWYGRAVPREDAQLVVATLLRAGVQIKVFEERKGLQASLVQVGADPRPAVKALPALDPASLRPATSKAVR